MKENFLNTTLRNVAWFKKVSEDDELDMKPPFQRNPVWVTRQKSYLIDTVLNAYPIPEIYMQETVDDDGVAKYIIVDGQQRIRSVLEFIEGQFAMDSKDSPNFADLTFEDLNVGQKKNFFQYNFVVRILPDIPDGELREIFQRLNKNVVALNRQELRQATYWGPFITAMNSISDKDAWSKIGIFSANDVRRMLDVEFISELTIALMHGLQNKKDNLDEYYQLYEEDFDEAHTVMEKFNGILGEILRILPDISKTRWRKKSDFYTMFLIFADRYENLPLSREQRSKAGRILKEFAKKVDLAVKTSKDKTEEKVVPPRSVMIYARGIRASTDLGSRRNRAIGLGMALQKLW